MTDVGSFDSYCLGKISVHFVKGLLVIKKMKKYSLVCISARERFQTAKESNPGFPMEISPKKYHSFA